MTTYVANFPLNLDGTVATADNADGDENNIPGWTAVSPVHASGELRPYTVTADPDVLQGAYIECDDTGFGDTSGRLEFDAVGTIAASTEVDWLTRFRVDVIHASYPSAGYFLDNGSGNGYALHIEADGDVRLWYIQGVSLWNSIGASIPKGAVVDEWYWARVHKTAGGKWSWKLWAGAYTEEPAGWDLGNGGEEGTSETTVTSGEVGIGLWYASAKADYNFFSVGIGEEAPGPFVRRVKTPPHEPLGLPPRVWTKRPPAGTPIDWTNPLTNGLHLAFAFQDNVPRDAVHGVIGTQVNAADEVHQGRGGMFFPRGTGTGNGAQFELPPTGPGNAFEFGPTDNAPATIFSFFQALPPLSSTDEYQLSDNYNAGSGYSDSWADTTVEDGLPHTAAMGWVQNYTEFWFDGISRVVDTTTRTYDGGIHQFRYDGNVGQWEFSKGQTSATKGDINIGGGENKNNDSWRGWIYAQYYWHRLLTSAEIAALHRNPWQIFKPRVAITYKPVHRHLVMT